MQLYPICDDKAFAVANTSTTWQIVTVQAQCDLAAFDSGLHESYIKLMEESQKFTLNYNAFISQYQRIIKKK